MEKDILSLIANESPKLSKGQKLISKYILENYDKAAFMTAGKLGKTVGISESTVVRFAAQLGFEGYPDMRKALQDMIRNRLTSVQRIEVAREQISDTNVLRSVLESDMEKIQASLELNSDTNFSLAVDTIVRAEHVYIMGIRSSSALSSFLAFYLNLIMENVRLVQDSGINDTYEQILRVRGSDVFVGISYPRYSSRTLRAMKFAKAAGAKVIGISDSEASPLVGIADIMLYAKSDMVSFLDSLVAPLSLINALIVSIGFRSNGSLSDTFSRLESIWAEYEVYDYSES